MIDPDTRDLDSMIESFETAHDDVLLN